MLPPTGSEELRIRIYEQQNNVKLLSKKGIQKAVYMSIVKQKEDCELRPVCYYVTLESSRFVLKYQFLTSKSCFKNNKIDNDANVTVYVKIYWKKLPSHLLSCKSNPLVIIVHKVSRCHGAMQISFAVLKIAGGMSQGSYRTVSNVSQYFDSISFAVVQIILCVDEILCLLHNIAT